MNVTDTLIVEWAHFVVLMRVVEYLLHPRPVPVTLLIVYRPVRKQQSNIFDQSSWRHSTHCASAFSGIILQLLTYLWSQCKQSKRFCLQHVLLLRDAMHSSVFAVVLYPSIRLSVCLFIMFSYCVKPAKLTIRLFSLPSGTVILFFPQETDCEIPTRSPPTWAPNRSGFTKHLRFSTTVSSSLGNVAR